MPASVPQVVCGCRTVVTVVGISLRHEKCQSGMLLLISQYYMLSHVAYTFYLSLVSLTRPSLWMSDSNKTSSGTFNPGSTAITVTAFDAAVSLSVISTRTYVQS